MKSALFLLFILFSGFAHATPWIAGSYGLRFEKDTDTGKLADRYPYSLLSGYRWTNNEVFAEFNTFSLTTGNATLEIKRVNQILLAGYRYYPFNLEGFSWYPYFSAAVGGTRELVTTKFLGMTDERESQLNLVGSIGAGTWGLVVKHFRAGAEFRLLTSNEFNPSVMLDLSVRAGYEF